LRELIVAGFSLAAAMYSWIVLAGKSCFTATTCGKSESLVTGIQVAA
jgi:hypothetical protein